VFRNRHSKISAWTQIPEGTPSLTTVPAHGYLLVWFDEQPDQGVLHINYKLGTGTDAVYILAPDMLSILDSVNWTTDTALAADVSYGRYPDGTENWMLMGTGFTYPASPGTNNGTAGIEDQFCPAAPSLSLFPNPVKYCLNIELTNIKGTADLLIFNIKGQLVRRTHIAGETRFTWDLKDNDGINVGSGIYFIRVKTEGKTLSAKTCVIKE